MVDEESEFLNQKHTLFVYASILGRERKRDENTDGENDLTCFCFGLPVIRKRLQHEDYRH